MQQSNGFTVKLIFLPSQRTSFLLNPLKQLGSQTAIYGLSTVAVRLLNYLLAPLHTNVFVNQADYGVISEMYAYVTFLNVIFMYGMETAFFRFASHSDQPGKVFSTAFTSLLLSTTGLVTLLVIFSQPIANALAYPDNSNFVMWFALIIGLDTLVNIPFAKLRLENKPIKYALIKLVNVSINIGLNFFFLLPALKGEAN